MRNPYEAAPAWEGFIRPYNEDNFVDNCAASVNLPRLDIDPAMTPEQRKRVWKRIELRLGLLSGMLAGLGAVLLLRK